MTTRGKDKRGDFPHDQLASLEDLSSVVFFLFVFFFNKINK